MEESKFLPKEKFLKFINIEFSIKLLQQIDKNLNIYSNFPKLNNFVNNNIGIDIFNEKHFFPRENRDIKRTISISIKNRNEFNNEIFVNITEDKILNKTIDECIELLNKYIEIVEFFIIYLKNTQEKSKINENLNNFIEKYSKQIKEIKSKIYESKNEKNKQNIEKIKENLDNLLSSKIENKDSFTIEKIKKEFKLNENSKFLIDIFLLKNNIVYVLMKSFPSLYLHKIKKKDEKIKSDKLLEKNLNILVKNSKLIPLSLNELVKCLKIILILNGHFTTIFPILNKREFLLYSALFRKMKFFYFG